ncbi:MAG: lysophospholipid acyltransferase family protein [Planctomycetaceae bacterium]|jgi:KDO2-lipid IV(A) lauroyltransferase|nr:lysophospholipid acyltransferase family protein [Planctomycetaceae bacterium]
MKNIIDYIVYFIVRIVVCITQSLSIDAGHTFAKGFAFLFTEILPARQDIVRNNLTIAFPQMSVAERKRINRKMWEHLFLMLVEIALAPRKIRELNWADHVQLVGVRQLMACLRKERPLILVTAHFGNFEMGGYMLGALGYPSHSVARTLDNRYLNDYVKQFREVTGQFLISKNEGYEDILHVLETNGTMAFLADQSAGHKGCFVNFFGKPASTFKAIALFSLQYDAPIVVTASTRVGEKPMQFKMCESGFIDPRNLPEGIQNVKQITQWYTSELEKMITEQPEQYWWIHNRWKERSEG